MKLTKSILIAMLAFAAWMLPSAFNTHNGYHIGDMAEDFNLKNVDGKMVSLGSYKDAKGFIVVFTCNHCPYAKAYESRIIELDNQFKAKGYPVIAINPNDPSIVPDDSYENMQKVAKKKKYPFPYLLDETQEVFKKYGATKTPHVYVLQKVNGSFMVQYIGAIDDNYEDEKAVTQEYVANAVNALLNGAAPEPSETKAIGCSIKFKK